MTPPRRAHDPPLSTQTYLSRGARFASYSGQSVNLAHFIWRVPRAPAPLYGAPSQGFLGGAMGVGGEGARNKSCASRRADKRNCCCALPFLGFLSGRGFGDTSVSPNRFGYRDRAIWRVKSASRRCAADFQRKSGLDSSYRPPTIEVGLWGRHSLHQSLPDEEELHRVATLFRKVAEVPALHFVPAGMTSWGWGSDCCCLHRPYTKLS